MGKRLIIAVIMAAMLSCAVPVLTSSPASAAPVVATVTPAGWVCTTYECYYVPPPPPIPLVQVSFGWVIYVHLSHAALGDVLFDTFLGGAAAGIGFACTLIGIGVLTAACAVLFGAAFAYFIALFEQAYGIGDGIVLEWTYVLGYFGYLIAPDSWT